MHAAPSSIAMRGASPPPETASARVAALRADADVLRRAGRLDEAYETLTRAWELERDTYRALERRSLALEQLQKILRDQADRDWLTGLHNRRFLDREIACYEHFPVRRETAVAIIDIDHFKLINDRYGHGGGDRVLITVARLLQALTRRRDTLVRSGGEEFVLVMPQTSEAAAVAHCDRIRHRLAAQAWDDVDGDLVVTASIGVAWTDEPSRVREAIRIADHRLYGAKASGRDRVLAGGVAV